MDISLLITLQEYGLSEKVANVYLTILELGTNIASTIARRSEIKRVTVYTILDDLKKKWIVNEITKDDIKYYSVISPVHKDPLFAFLSDDDIVPELQQYLNTKFLKQRKEMGIHSSVIVRDTESNKQYLESTKKDKLTEVRLVDNALAWIEWELILFWWDKIACALYSPNELMWYTIQSRQLYSSLKSIFMFMRNQLPWQKSKKK